MVVVTGANNTGKTALLTAFDVVAGRYGEAGSRPQHAAATLPAQVRARFELSAEEREPLLEHVKDETIRPSNALAWLEWHFVQIGGALQAAELHAAWPGGDGVPLVQVAPPDSGGEVTWRISDAGRQLHGESGSHEFNELGGFQSIEGILWRFAPSLAPASQFLAAWRAHYYHFQGLRPGTSARVGLSSEPVLAPTGANLPAVLLHLKTNDLARWLRIRELMEQIVPDVGLMETRTEGSQVWVAFSDPHVPGYEPNLKELGTGVEQLLMTIVLGLTHPAPSVVLMEEPETNLHAGAQRALLGLLQEWAVDRLFVVSTHSQVLLDRAPTAGSLLLVQRERGVSTVTPLTRESSEALAALGVRLSDVLSADRLLLVEGPSDGDVLQAWFPDLLRCSHVEIIEGNGGDNARFAELLERWIQAADRLPGRRVLYLRDRDELPKWLLDKLETSSRVHVLRRRELENYLLDPDAIAKVLGARGRPVDPGEISVALREAADSLRPLVVLKRVAWERASIRLVDRDLIRKLVREGPDLARLRAAMAERMPGPELLEQIAERWAAVEAEIVGEWDEHWMELAPGEEILDSLWRTYAAAGYDKDKDGLAIAQAMAVPPEELRIQLGRFLEH